ncbi:MAG: hypothetical protein U1F76_31900 [Candidatus Competibacteraceae bacterium]
MIYENLIHTAIQSRDLASLKSLLQRCKEDRLYYRSQLEAEAKYDQSIASHIRVLNGWIELIHSWIAKLEPVDRSQLYKISLADPFSIVQCTRWKFLLYRDSDCLLLDLRSLNGSRESVDSFLDKLTAMPGEMQFVICQQLWDESYESSPVCESLER